MKIKKNKLDEFSYHEAMDRSAIFLDIIERGLVNHPVVKKHKRIRKKLNKALSILSDVYQDLGHLSFDDNLKQNKQI